MKVFKISVLINIVIGFLAACATLYAGFQRNPQGEFFDPGTGKIVYGHSGLLFLSAFLYVFIWGAVVIAVGWGLHKAIRFTIGKMDILSVKRGKRIIVAVSVAVFLGLALIGVFGHGFAAVGYNLLQWAAEDKNTTLSKILLGLGAPPSPYKEIYYWDYFAEISDTPLHTAAKSGDIELAKALIAHGVALDWCCCTCVTPLHEAIRNRNPEMVKLLLMAGADTKTPYDLTTSVMELAKNSGTPEIVETVAAYEQRLNAGSGENAVSAETCSKHKADCRKPGQK